MLAYIEAAYNIALAKNAKPILSGIMVIGFSLLVSYLLVRAIRGG